MKQSLFDFLRGGNVEAASFFPVLVGSLAPRMDRDAAVRFLLRDNAFAVRVSKQGAAVDGLV